MRKQLTKEEQALITRLKGLVKYPDDFATDKEFYWSEYGARPPVASKVVEAAEKELGFPLPPLLRELFIQVGNGGFGPRASLLRLISNDPKDDEAVVTTYKMSTGPDVPPEYDSWHHRHIIVAHWGCNIYSVVDCTTADGAVYRYWLDRYAEEDDGLLRDYGILEAASLREWFELWLAGEDISNDYGQPPHK